MLADLSATPGDFETSAILVLVLFYLGHHRRVDWSPKLACFCKHSMKYLTDFPVNQPPARCKSTHRANNTEHDKNDTEASAGSRDTK